MGPKRAVMRRLGFFGGPTDGWLLGGGGVRWRGAAGVGVWAGGGPRVGGRRFEPWELLVMAVPPGPAAEGGQTSMDPDPAGAMGGVHPGGADGAGIGEVPGVPSVAPFLATGPGACPGLGVGVGTGRGEGGAGVCGAGGG